MCVREDYSNIVVYLRDVDFSDSDSHSDEELDI